MSYDELLQHVRDYFGDTSRPASETKRDLNTLGDECFMLAESIESDNSDE